MTDYISKTDLLLALAELPQGASKREMLRVVYDMPVGPDLRDMAYWLIESPFTENGWRSGDIRPLIADREVVWGGYCSACNTPALFTEYGTNTAYSQYCPKCGALMKNWQSEELADTINKREAREADLYWQARHQQEAKT